MSEAMQHEVGVHLGHVAWKDAHDLRVKLEASIRANIITRA